MTKHVTVCKLHFTDLLMESPIQTPQKSMNLCKC